MENEPNQYWLMLGDCLEEMKRIPNGSVDAIISDLPYGTTQCKWDTVIPFKPMWEQFKRVIKPRGAIVLFGSEPFSSLLRVSNLDWFKYDWVWDKKIVSGFLNVTKAPMRGYDVISIFCKKQTVYNPQMVTRTPSELSRQSYKAERKKTQPSKLWGQSYILKNETYRRKEKYPSNVIRINGIKNGSREKTIHPAQKPVALLEYLIKTYTNEGETVLDCVIGSGTTGVAAMRTGRNFIGIEMEKEYFDIAETRIRNAAGDFTLTKKEIASGQMSILDQM